MTFGSCNLKASSKASVHISTNHVLSKTFDFLLLPSQTLLYYSSSFIVTNIPYKFKCYFKEKHTYFATIRLWPG
ncbi:hypothetical protein E1H99_04825 [Enterococcus hirae]|nr:hypothetical protein E1H99_04825 [Enterococcus hirae]